MSAEAFVRQIVDALDVQDVLDVLFGKLELAYIRNWCDQHGTREPFE
jgi:hypothetical protein